MRDYIHDGKAPPLEGQGDILYAIGGNAQGLFLRLTGRESEESNRPGTLGRGNPICLHELLSHIADALHNRRSESGGCYFKREDLKTPDILGSVEGDASTNVPGFVIAVLIDIGFVEAVNPNLAVSDGKYRFRQKERKLPPRTRTASPTRERS